MNILALSALIVPLIKDGVQIYQTASAAMSAIEHASPDASGADKKTAVLNIVEQSLSNAPDLYTEYAPRVGKYIDDLKALYNSVHGVASTETATSETAPAPASSATQVDMSNEHQAATY